MNINQKEILERVLLMMKYDSSKTLNENIGNIQIISEQPSSPPKFTETTKKNILRCKSDPRDYSWILKNNKERLKNNDDVDSFCKSLSIMFSSQYSDAEEFTPENLEKKEKTEKILSNVTILDPFKYYLVLGDTNTGNSTNNGEVTFMTYKKYQEISQSATKNWRNLILRTVKLEVYYRGEDKFNLKIPELVKTYNGSTKPGQKMGSQLNDKRRTWNQTGIPFGQKIDLTKPGFYVIVATTNENKKFGQKITNFKGFSEEEYKKQSGESIEKNSDSLKYKIFDENNDVKNGISTNDLLKYIDLRHDEGKDFENDISFQRVIEYLMNRISSMNYNDLLNLQKSRSNKVGTITTNLPGFNNGLRPTLTSVLIENQIYQYRIKSDPFEEPPHYELANNIDKKYVLQNFITLSNEKEKGRARSQQDSDLFRKWFLLNFPEKSKNPCGENKPLLNKGIYNEREIICAYDWKPLSNAYLTENEKNLGLREKTAFEIYDLVKNNKNLRLQVWDPTMYKAITTNIPMKEGYQINFIKNHSKQIKKIENIINYILNEQTPKNTKTTDDQIRKIQQAISQGSKKLDSNDPGKELYDKIGVKFVEIPIEKHDLVGKIYNRKEQPSNELFFPNKSNNNEERKKNSERPFNEPKYVYDEPSPSVQENLRYCLDYFTKEDHQILELCGINKQILKNMFQTNRCNGVEEFLINKLSECVKSKKLNPEDFLYLINKQRNYKGFGTLGGTFMKGNPIGSKEYKVKSDYTTEYINKPTDKNSEEFKKILDVLENNKRILSIWTKEEYRCLVGIDGKDICGNKKYCGTSAKFYFIEVANATRVLTEDEIEEWKGTKEGSAFERFCSTQEGECNLIIGNYVTTNVTGEKILIRPKNKFNIPCSSDFMEEWSGFLIVGSIVLSFLLPPLLEQLGPVIVSLFNTTRSLSIGATAAQTAITADNWRKLGQMLNLLQNVLVGGVFTYEAYQQKDKVGTYLGLFFTVLPIIMEFNLVRNHLMRVWSSNLQQTENAIRGLQSKVNNFINANPNFTMAEYNNFLQTLTVAEQGMIESVIQFMKAEPKLQQYVLDVIKQRMIAAYLEKFGKINTAVHVGLLVGVFGFNYIKGYIESDYYNQRMNLLNSQKITPKQANLLDVFYYNMDNQEKAIIDALIKGDPLLLQKVLKNANARNLEKFYDLLLNTDNLQEKVEELNELIENTTKQWIKEEIEHQYNLFKENNPNSTISFEDWKYSLSQGIYDDYLEFLETNKGVTFSEFINDSNSNFIEEFNSYKQSNPTAKLDYKKWKNAKKDKTLEEYDIYLKTATTKVSYDDWLKQKESNKPKKEDPFKKK